MTDKLLFKPISKTHAIDEAIFYIEFEPGISDNKFTEIKRKITESHTFKSFFTDAIVDIPNTTGIQMTSSRDTELKWGMFIRSNMFSLHCLDYTRWKEGHADPVWPRAEVFLKALLSEVMASKTLPGRIGLKYIDKFRLNGEIGEYDVNWLLDKSAAKELVPDHIFELKSPLRWHTNNGWFEPFELSAWGKVELLHQLNILSAMKSDEAGEDLPPVQIRIDHSTAITAVSGEIPLTEENIEDQLDGLYQALHIGNKKLIEKLLTKQAQNSINLNAK